jgi:hypothetical protein
MEHSALGLGIDLTGTLPPTWPLPKRHDPPDLWTPPPTRYGKIKQAGEDDDWAGPVRLRHPA